MPTLAKTRDQFVDLLRKSHLLSPDQIVDALGNRVEEDPKVLAARLVQNGTLTRFQAQSLLQGRYRNFIVGKYRVLEPIGAGGMSKVYLGEHTAMGHRVALKILPASRVKDPSLVERFHREARAIAALNHPNIVRAHDIDKEESFYYIVMDYVEGLNLDDLVKRRGPLDPEHAAYYIDQAADGLQHIHEAGMVHRDIKPGNLLLDRAGTVRILDLGLARFLTNRRDQLTEKYDENTILGTADFLSPEQGLKSHTVDIRADIYSLGATLYYLLTGRTPYEGGTVTQKLLAVQLKDPTPLISIRPELPPGLVAVVETMMVKKPDERYQTPGEVCEALAPWTQNPPPPPPSEIMPRVTVSPHRTPPPTPGLDQSAQPTLGAASTLRNTGASARKKMGRTTRLTEARRPVWKRRRLLIALGSALALALILLVWRPWRAAQPNPAGDDTVAAGNQRPAVPVELPSPPPGSLVVAAAGAEPRYPTVAAALAAAKPGQRTTILIRNPVHQEQLSLAGSKATNVTIESHPGMTATWVPPPGAPDNKGLLDLTGVEGVRVKGIRFDGQQRIRDLVKVTGACPELTLDDIQVTGFTRSGVAFFGCTGTESRLVTVQRLLASGGGEGASGVLFEQGIAHKSIQLLDCRFDGPMASGVAIAGPLTGFNLLRGRFFRLQQGVHYRPAGTPTAFNARIRNNTFCEVTTGVEFLMSPPVASANEVQVIDNLFVSTGHLAQLYGVPLMPQDRPIPAWIWTDTHKVPSAPKPLYFRKAFTLPTKPANPVVLNIGCDESFTVWVNGKEVGKSTHGYFSQRVYAFDVTEMLTPGPNLIAVEGTNEIDPYDKTYGTAAALTAELVEMDPAKPRVVLTSDESWKVSKTLATGWEKLEFNDSEWATAQVWTLSGINYPWRETVWDSVVGPNLGGQNRPIKLTTGGNARDYYSVEGYPVLESKRTVIKPTKGDPVIGLDPADDAKFLRYSPGSPLATGGKEQGPVGVPPLGS